LISSEEFCTSEFGKSQQDVKDANLSGSFSSNNCTWQGTLDMGGFHKAIYALCLKNALCGHPF
jgi:hypothetical protein